MHTLDLMTIICQSTLGSLGLALNLFFIYLILFKSSKHLHAYSVLLLHMSLNDIVSSLCVVYTIGRQIPMGESGGLGVSLGPCRLISSWSCSVGFLIWIHCYANCRIILILSFIFRLYIIQNRSPTRRQTILVCALSYLPSFIYLVILIEGIFSNNGYEERKEELIRTIVVYTRPDLLQPYVELEGRSDKNTFNGMLSLFYVLFLGPIAMIICLIVRWKIQRVLAQVKSLSSATRRMNEQLLRALTIQNGVEFFMLICLFIFFLSFGPGFLTTRFIEHTVFILAATIHVTNPLINLVCITHYKRELLRMLPKGWQYKVDSTNYGTTVITNYCAQQYGSTVSTSYCAHHTNSSSIRNSEDV